eukprot:TRINITY_DN2002_c0_g1_i4.p1 TRINITY_DN2002_c0_g1~~TRINITY_DN2002_c0_g1_i4.p1  ORF type:complete len:112 (-),score=1.15 TRINITY_DN2002_c0_g1_i4:202-537(-)
MDKVLQLSRKRPREAIPEKSEEIIGLCPLCGRRSLTFEYFSNLGFTPGKLKVLPTEFDVVKHYVAPVCAKMTNHNIAPFHTMIMLFAWTEPIINNTRRNRNIGQVEIKHSL